MIGPSDTQGEVLISCLFGLVAADERNWSIPIEAMITDEAWQEEIRLAEGPHCLIYPELDIPF